MASKTQRLRMTADGFMAGLAVCGYRGPWRWSHLDWEFSFYRAWAAWPPAKRAPRDFPRFEIGGGAGATSQARDMLWQLKKTSPFHDFQSAPMNDQPMGLSHGEFLEIWTPTARPQEWIALAAAFLEEMRKAGH